MWGPDNPIVATWPASMIPTLGAMVIVVLAMINPKRVHRVVPVDWWLPIAWGYIVVFVLGNIIFLMTKVVLDEGAYTAMGSCRVACLPIQEEWQHIWLRMGWAMLIVPSFMLSPLVLYFTWAYLRRRRLARKVWRTAGN